MLVGPLECRNQRVPNYKGVKNEELILTRIVGHLRGSLFYCLTQQSQGIMSTDGKKIW